MRQDKDPTYNETCFWEREREKEYVLTRERERERRKEHVFRERKSSLLNIWCKVCKFIQNSYKISFFVPINKNIKRKKEKGSSDSSISLKKMAPFYIYINKNSTKSIKSVAFFQGMHNYYIYIYIYIYIYAQKENLSLSLSTFSLILFV